MFPKHQWHQHQQHQQQQQQKKHELEHPTYLVPPQRTKSLQHSFAQQPKEPMPNATDAKPNITLSITEIAEFSSTIVYLLWHVRRQSVMDLHSSSKTGVMSTITNPEQIRTTADMANMTSRAFKKFCRQILSATQLSESVVLLSLKYIAILLHNSPGIQGADGSEYRLFTVALMLANKYLDDNTFTNKTWSEVSGMKVIDLNIMELEFLDVLQFKLSIKKEEYERWRMALFGLRSQLLDISKDVQKQKIMETIAISTHPLQWPQQQQRHFLPHPTYYLEQQRTSMISSVMPTPTTRDFHLFSKSQQKYPQPIIHGPFTRVQLKIPPHPVYQRMPATSSVPVMSNPINVYNPRSSSLSSVVKNEQNETNTFYPDKGRSVSPNMSQTTYTSYPQRSCTLPSSKPAYVNSRTSSLPRTGDNNNSNNNDSNNSNSNTTLIYA
ncbi:hypothetical protein RMATCC62417_05173 [Rhizopus microsporus]|nr:hypothetical protein RMATCC62417_05173 [Rhizopus microsporus]